MFFTAIAEAERTDLGQSQRREWRVFSWLHHDSAARSQSSAHLPGDHSTGEIPLQGTFKFTSFD